MNIKLVVVDGDALAYIQPESPNNFCTLGSSIKSLHHWGQGPKPLFGCTVRPATRADFETYRIELPPDWEQLLSE